MTISKTTTRRVFAMAGGVSILLLCAAWTQSRRPVSIPFGEWTGEGTFVHQTWNDGGESDSATVQTATVTHRRYATRLNIHPRKLDGHEVIWVEICSERGEIPGLENLGRVTHIQAALEEEKRVSESIVLYRLVGFRFNPRDDRTSIRYDASNSRCAASCMSISDKIILQIQYAENLSDTFLFDSIQVTKSGMLRDKNYILDWTEILTHVPTDVFACAGNVRR